MKKALLLAAIIFSGCVSKRTALKYGRDMYDVGYAQATTESALTRLRWTMEKTIMQAELDRRDEEAEERNRRSNPYAIRP